MSDKVRILQILGGGSSLGGVERMLLNYYKYIDRSQYLFDFCFIRENTFPLIQDQYGDILEDSNIYELSVFSGKSTLNGYCKGISKIKNIIRIGNYDVVHINAGRPALLIVGLIAAKQAHAKSIILHSHSTNPGLNNLTIRKSMMRIIQNVFTHYGDWFFACSIDAGKYMFGNNIQDNPRFELIRNAIDPTKYYYNESKRKEIRENNSIDDNTILFGHVGRLSEEKNHLFLIKVFKFITEKAPNSKLWVIGDGDQRSAVEETIEELGITEKALLMGSRSDVPDLLQAIDVMVFPSLYEGLSVTLVEAQAASVEVFASDTISQEHTVTNLIKYIPLSDGEQKWADYVINHISIPFKKGDTSEEIRNSGYCVKDVAKKMENIYREAVK